MRYAIIENGTVVNAAEATAEFAAEQGWVAAPDDVQAGWTYDGQFTAPIVPLDDVKAAKKAEIKAVQTGRFAAGWTHDFGAAGVHTLDLRPGTNDKSNWTLLLIKTQGMIGAGFGAAPVSLRTAADELITITANEANAAMTAFLAWGEALLSHKWELDDAVDAAANTQAVAAIDAGAGWP